jgi:photosystem II stability/assembly factor-like uncharacterized protein
VEQTGIIITMPIGFRIPTFYKITFVKNLIGWIAGSDRRIFKTTDFGDTWFYLDSIAVSPQMRFAEFIDENTGFVGGEQGYLFKSTNGGINWVRENTSTFPPNEIISMHLYNNMVGWIAGGEAKIFATTTGGQTLVNITNTNNLEIDEFLLNQNYPNPYNPSTIITFSLTKKAYVEIKIYDIHGREIKIINNKILSAGNYELSFDATNLNSGIYFYSMFADGVKINTKRMIYLK